MVGVVILVWMFVWFFGFVEFVCVFMIVLFMVVFGFFVIEWMILVVMFVIVIVVLCLVGVVILWVCCEEFFLLWIVLFFFIVFFVWVFVSVVWLIDKFDILFGWMLLFGFVFLVIMVGYICDILQMVCVIGDILCGLFVVLFVVEIFLGILFDLLFMFFGIQGNFVVGGLVQGLFGSWNMFGFVVVIVLIMFVIEWCMQLVDLLFVVVFIVFVGLLVFFLVLLIVFVFVGVVGVVMVVFIIVWYILLVRCNLVQWIFGVFVVFVFMIVFVLCYQIIVLLDVGFDFLICGLFWNMIFDFVVFKFVQGWGWFGDWVCGEYFFIYINFQLDDYYQSVLNVFFDVLLQFGVVGLVLFLLLGGVVLICFWLVVSVCCFVVYVWMLIIFVIFVVDLMFESFMFVGVGWFLFVLCVLCVGQFCFWCENIDVVQIGVILIFWFQEQLGLFVFLRRLWSCFDQVIVLCILLLMDCWVCYLSLLVVCFMIVKVFV